MGFGKPQIDLWWSEARHFGLLRESLQTGLARLFIMSNNYTNDNSVRRNELSPRLNKARAMVTDGNEMVHG